jgi:hypothetical protein
LVSPICGQAVGLERGKRLVLRLSAGDPAPSLAILALAKHVSQQSSRFRVAVEAGVAQKFDCKYELVTRRTRLTINASAF